MEIGLAARVDGHSHNFMSVVCFTDNSGKLRADIFVRYGEDKTLKVVWEEDDARVTDAVEAEQLIRQHAGRPQRMAEAADLMGEVLKATYKRHGRGAAIDMLNQLCGKIRDWSDKELEQKNG